MMIIIGSPWVLLLLPSPSIKQDYTSKPVILYQVPESKYKAFMPRFKEVTNISDKSMTFMSPKEKSMDSKSKEQQSSPKISKKPTPAYVNPGCVKHTLDTYRSMQTSKHYDHPPIVHYIKITKGVGSSRLSLREYLSMMSAYKFLKPTQIIVHSTNNIEGEYWDQARKWVGTSVKINFVTRIAQLNGKRVKWTQHAADYVKVSQLLKHGGLVSDFDVIIINGTRLKEEQRKSECVIAQESDTLHAGFVSCIKDSFFVRQWLDAYHNDYQSSSWLYNSVNVPTNILLDQKSSVCYDVHLDDTICLRPNEYDAPRQWLSPSGVPHWKEKTAAHYYLNRVKLPPDDRLLVRDNSLGEMLRYVHNYKLS